MADLNTWSDVSSIAQRLEEDAYFIVRETGTMVNLVKTFTDGSGANIRRGYKFNNITVRDIGDEDDLTSQAFTPSADQDLTPAEHGAQIALTDLRMESELPEDIMNDSGQELGLAAVDSIEADLVGNLSSLTGGTVGTAGSTMTWAYLSAAIAQARNANKSNAKPLFAMIHAYQWTVLAAAANIAGASANVAGSFEEDLTRIGFVKMFEGVPIFRTFQPVDSSDDFAGGVFPREAIAMDWRRLIRVRPERDESRRVLELNMSMVYAHGVWRPDLGVVLLADASAPTGV